MVITQLIFFVLGLTFISLSFFKKPERFKGLDILFIVTGGLLIRIMVSLYPCLHDWDEKFHALVSKNLIDDFLKSGEDCISSHFMITRIKEFTDKQPPDIDTYIYNSDLNIEIMFFTDQIAYPYMPSATEIHNLLKNNNVVLIVGHEIPAEIKSIPGIYFYDPVSDTFH